MKTTQVRFAASTKYALFAERKLLVHVGLHQLKTNNKERRLAVRCYISHLFEQPFLSLSLL